MKQTERENHESRKDSIMQTQTFEGKLETLLLLAKDWRTSEIFKAEAKKLIDEIMDMITSGTDLLTFARCLGALQGVIEIQDRWLHEQSYQAQQEIDSGEAGRVTTITFYFH